MFLGLVCRRNVAAEITSLNLGVILSLQPALKSLVAVANRFSHSWSFPHMHMTLHPVAFIHLVPWLRMFFLLLYMVTRI